MGGFLFSVKDFGICDYAYVAQTLLALITS